MRAEDDLTYQEYKENVEDAWLDTETGYRQNDG